MTVFDDTNPNAYYDPANPMGSVRVAGTGTKIKVVKSGPDGIHDGQGELTRPAGA